MVSNCRNCYSRRVVGFYPTTQSARAPIVCFYAMSRLLVAMIAHLSLDDRLSVLRVGDAFRGWNSLDDQRVCLLCGRKFKGRQVDVRRLPGGKFRLCCPTLGCLSRPYQWRYAKAPAGSDRVKKYWRHDRPNKRQGRVPESTLRREPCCV